VTTMNRHIFSITVGLTVLAGAWVALAQDSEKTAPESSPLEMRQRYRDMSPAEREKFQVEMRQMRERWQNMSEAEREKIMARMRERLRARAPGLGREEQLNAIKMIEEQLAKLKADVEVMAPENRKPLQDLSEEERAALREKMMAAARDRRMAIRSIERELAKLSGPRRPEPDAREQIAELRKIHELAVKENATKTAERIEALIADIRREAARRGPRPEPRPRGDVGRPRPGRPPRPDPPERGDSARSAKPFTLTSFDGKTVSLADYRGKTVVLEWLNYECPFVRYHYEQAGTMVKLAKKYKDQGVVWLAINSTSHSTAEANRAFAAKHKLPYPVLDDRAGTVGRAYGAKTTPHVFVIDRRGRIVYDGAIDNAPMGKTLNGEKPVNYVDQTLTEVLAGKDITTHQTKSYGCSVKYAQ
jgi:peroxiredoxin